VIVDIGTGDGRSVLDRARREPSALVIGVDAAAAAMAEASRRAVRRGPANVLFLAAGVEHVGGSPLAGTAHLVTVSFPWGSLLRGIIGLDAAALDGVATLLAPDGRLEVLASVEPDDGVPGLACLDHSVEPAIRTAWSGVGLELAGMRPASAQDVQASGSSWARRLAAGATSRADGTTRAGRTGRAVWRLDGRRLG
jgi:16S rRNA (adenine(1408)-N(1))-methyltransferase